MPTVGWMIENAIDRFAERFWKEPPGPDPAPMQRPVFVCKWCNSELSSPEALDHHFSLSHPLALPALYVHGAPLLRESMLRVPIREGDVDLVHCTRCQVQMDGGPRQWLTLPAFRAQFAQST